MEKQQKQIVSAKDSFALELVKLERANLELQAAVIKYPENLNISLTELFIKSSAKFLEDYNSVKKEHDEKIENLEIAYNTVMEELATKKHELSKLDDKIKEQHDSLKAFVTQTKLTCDREVEVLKERKQEEKDYILRNFNRELSQGKIEALNKALSEQGLVSVKQDEYNKNMEQLEKLKNIETEKDLRIAELNTALAKVDKNKAIEINAIKSANEVAMAKITAENEQLKNTVEMITKEVERLRGQVASFPEQIANIVKSGQPNINIPSGK